jgi:predicted GNAT family acetyltransferase
MPNKVRNDPAASRYELDVPDGLAIADYLQRGDTLYITHTEVPPSLQGRGIAAQLVAGLLEDVRARGLKVVPLCSYVDAYFRRHPDQRDLLARESDD